MKLIVTKYDHRRCDFDTFGFEEVFLERFLSSHADLIMVAQDGDYIQIPTPEFRQFIAALTKLADDEGIPT